MNYGGNMPDWHQYNAAQTNEVTSSTQNVNSGHLAFIPGVNHSTLNAHSLGSESLNKHQNDANFNPRNYQSYNNVSNGPNIPNNSPLASMVQMQNCIGHYGSTNTRNPMLDNINASVDPRNATVGVINDELGYRTNQVPFNGPIGHLSGPSCNLNASSGPIPGPGPGPGTGFGSQTNSGPGSNSGNNSGTGPGPNSMYGPGPRHGPMSGPGSVSGSGNLGPRNTNINSVSSGKSGTSSFMPCKGVCCNSNPNINYQQWEKFGLYQNSAPFRDNVHLSGCQMENRHFGNNYNFRKDNLEGKEVMGPVLPNAPAIDHRRNYSDYKYHKDHLAHRNYPASSGMFHNYPVQNYNYSTEHQKYTYPVKEHPKANNMNMSNSGMLKHQEQNFINQQKFNNKQFQYQNGNILPKGMPTLNVNSNMATSPQNPYFNPQFPRNITTEMNHECQETTDSTTVVNRIPNTFMHSTPPQHQVYQHKIAMQKYAMENHLREMSNIPGYQSHPKYKECVLRYREILKLQQSTGYQNPVQQNPRVATPVNASVPPINLHFDQNGLLINSSYIADGFSKVQHAPSVESSESIEKQSKDQAIAIANEKRQQLPESEQLIIPPQCERIPSSCVETFPKQNQFPVRKDFNQNQLKVQTSENHNFDTLNAVNNNETAMLQQKASKEFANKPQLDVRQFLANWDETDDEDGAPSNLQDTALNETTPVVVVSYENVDVPSKTPQGTEVSKRTSYCSNETDLDKGKEGETNVIATQDCLTISYSPPENTEIAKTSKRTIREGVVKPGSIIHCISNGPDEIPTIHIVDNLEISNILGTCSEQVIQTLEKQKTISFFKETSNNETEPMPLEDAEQQDKNETDVLSTNYDGSLNDVTKNTNMEDSDPVRTNAVSINSQELRAKNNLDVTNNMDLRKQNSFASEESHNPDDISLPDLPTSECTPISTTLNTPIHSDTEESSQNMEDLSISTNPIEVMQNSPVISFTQLNSEEKSKNGSLGTLELEFQKQSGYKTNDQEVTLGNFNFASDSKVKSAESAKGKQVKCLGTNAVRKKSFLIDGKEIDTRISDTCDALTSMEYELDVEQEPVEREKISERASPGCMKHRSARKSTDSMKSVMQSDSVDNIVHNVASVDINANLSPTESDDETQTSRRRRANISSASRSTNRSEVDQNTRKRAKERMDLDDRGANKYTERSSTRRRDTADHLRQSKGSNARRFDEASSSQTEEHTVCHMTSQYKNYSVAVIKDKVTLSDSRSGRGLDRTSGDKSPDTRTNHNTKELSDGMEIKKRVSGRPHESVPHQNSRKSELLQKDLKPIDGDVRYTAEEIRMLKEYRRRKAQDKSKHTFKSSEESQKNDESSSRSRSGKLECPQSRQSNELRHGACSLQNVLSVVNLSAKQLDTREEISGHACSKSFCKNADFGMQVTNVNLKIKDNDMGKELILSEKGPEQIKDSLEGIQIQINVSCTDQKSKGQEQNKRMLYDERGLYEAEESPALDCQCRLHTKEQETVDATRTTDKVDRIGDKPVDTVEVISTLVDKNANPLKKRRRSSMGINEDACVLTSTHNDACCKETLKTDSEGAVYPVDDKLKCAISNTAIVDANNKIKTKSKREDGDREDSRNLEMAKVQKAPSTSHVDTSVEAFKRHEEKESAHQPKNTKKLPDSGVEVNARSLSSLNTLDFNFDYKKYSNVGELDDDYPGKWKKPKIDQIFEDCDVLQSSSGYVNPIFSSIDKLEDLHTVPVYTTKDGKISYSPNRKFTYHELMMEARKRDACVPAKKSHYADTWNSYYSSKFRKLYKRRRHHPFSEKKKYEFKSTKYLYDRKKNYSDEFYGKSNTWYKDYVHSIKNNNAVWLDQYKMDRMYSSSDSDEEIKRRIDEASGCKKSHETKLVSPNSPRNHVTVDELDVDYRNKEDGTSDVCLSKDKDTCSKESQAVQLESLDAGTGNETCQDNDNNVNDNLAVMQTDVTLTATVNQGNEEAKSNLNECSALEESCEFAPEKIEVNESKNLSDECTEPSVCESKNSIVPDNEEETVNTVDGSSALELLNEVPSSTNQNEQIASSNVEEDKNSEMCVLETTQLDKQEEENVGSKESDDQLSTVDNTESIKQVELCEDLQTHQAESSQFEINVADCSSATESSESRANSSNINLQVSEESMEPEKYTDALNEIVEESSENIDDRVNEETSIITEENILGCAEENIELTEEIVILSKEQEPEECISEEIEKNVESLYENDSDSPKEALNEISEEQENSESQIDATIDQQNNLDFGVSETVENQKDIVIASVQMGQNEEEPILIDFSKDTIYNENDNAIESLDASNAEEMEIALSSIKDTSMEEQEMMDHLHDHCEDMQSMSEHNSNSSSVEKEMPVLNEYCTVNDSPVGHPDDIDRTENYDDTEKEDHLSFDPFDNCVHSPESNTDVKAIPKLIIKKTDALNPKSDSLSNSVEIDNCPDIYDAKLLPETRPKIPKMIIVKSRSRSATPTVELLEKAKSERTPQHSLEDNDVNVNVDNSDSEQYTLKYNNYKNKVPKVKIKLEDISSKDLKLYLKRKTSKSIPKMKIKKLKNQDVKAHISVSKVETQDTSETDATDSENENARQSSMVSDTESEKIPKLRLKRHDEDKSLEQTREKDCNVSKVIPKKSRKTKEEDTRHSVKQDNITTSDIELRKKFPQYIIEKVPKVIIKRTQIGAEFKCEISKSKKSSVAETSKWQPKVKLQRLELLDNIVKDLKQSKITLKNILNTPTRVTENCNSVTDNNNLNQNNKVKLSRSNSVSSLSPVKCKQRRLSDSGYLKTDTKSVSEFSDNSRNVNDRVAGSTSVISESPKKKNRKTLSSQSKSVNPDLNNQNETDETIASRSTVKDSFGNFLINEYNDLMITKSEYNSCFMSEESTLSAENKFLESDITQLSSYDNNDNSIIKVDTSDESQTTIEILPASPDSCDGETEKSCEFENTDKLRMEDAIPTQLELELELIDNKMRHSGVFMLDSNDRASPSKSKYSNEKSGNAYFSGFQRSSEDSFDQDKYMSEQNGQSSGNTSNDYFHSTDLLVKEVLAAKEALKKCLSRAENKDADSKTSRPKTVAEKKQGLSFNFKGFDESYESECAECNNGDDNAKVYRKSKNLEMKEHKSPRRADVEGVEERYLKQNLSVGKEIISKDSQNETIYTGECPIASTCGHTDVPESTTISLKASKKSDKNSTNNISTIETDITELTDKLKDEDDTKEFHGEKSEKETNSCTQSQKEEGSNDAKAKENNMPLLIPEFALNFDSSSDRDSSRSPPVITNQEEVDNAAVGEKSIENKVIAPINKIEESKDSYKDCEMTIADIITQLAYHEKATIKHKRYCNLCERWFPTTSRHRRHLAGYQHRYMELAQRKSIHALFILFTGKPCPRLLPATVIRNDCSIGELTPLQIAVQDIAKCVEYTQQDFKTKE